MEQFVNNLYAQILLYTAIRTEQEEGHVQGQKENRCLNFVWLCLLCSCSISAQFSVLSRSYPLQDNLNLACAKQIDTARGFL